ncbi:hypothetical protein BSLG_008612 [Batrachochytrium salamandrivorans]|nr:hypothetical protein BSLG_008612 [Batrachochytrium salamandrivorans]
MKHPVLGVLSILSISVYAATLPGHVDNAPLLVKRQVYPEDSPADSMNQSPESVGEPFDFSPSELGMMQTDANPSTPDSHGDPDINTDPSTPDSHGDPDSNADPSTSDSHGDPDSNADPSTSNSHGNPGSDTNLSTLGVYGDSDSDSSSDTDDGTDPFPEEQGAASHSLDGSSSSYDMARPSFIAPISNDMSTPFGYHRAQKHKVAHRHGAG